jgi:hypothetical protein
VTNRKAGMVEVVPKAPIEQFWRRASVE